jgi:hypothetical protein
MRTKAVLTDFSAGELSPRAEGRFDLPAYSKGCRTLENMVLDDLGGASMRPGTQYIAACESSSAASKLMEFQNTSAAAFLLEISNTNLNIYDQDVVHTTFTTAPWATADIFELCAPQSENTMYLFNDGYVPYKLAYTPSSDTFAFSAPTFTGTTFSASTDYPAAGVFHERRLVVGFTPGNPMTLWGSYSPDSTGATRYESFTVGTASDVAWKYTIASEKGDVGRWLASQRDLLIGCRGEEYIATGYDAGITPTNVYIKRQPTGIGSALFASRSVRGVNVFVQRGGKRVHQFGYSSEGGGYGSTDLTFLAEHITGTGIRDWAVQTNPKTILWCVTNDGELIGLTFNRQFGVVGWHRHTTDGYFESVAVLDGDTEDVVYFTVRRTVNSATVRYIEKLKPFDFGSVHEDAFFVDCGITWDGGAAETITAITKSATCTITLAATTAFVNNALIKITDSDMDEVNGRVYQLKNKSSNTFDLYTEDGTAQIDSSAFTAAATEGTATRVIKTVTGLSHLEGESVVALRDGAVQSPVTVTSGSAVLTRHANKVHIGLPYTGTLETLPIALDPGRTGQAYKAVLHLYETVGGKIGPSTDSLSRIRTGAATVLDEPPDLFSGRTPEHRIPGPREIGPSVVIVQDEPNPLTVLSMVVTIDLAEGE